MRRLSANYIFTNSGKPLKNGVVELSDDGIITNVIDTGGDLHEIANLEFYNGILIPGFVNAHCHLELSYLEGKLNPGGGLVSFIKQFVSERDFIPDCISMIIAEADNQMANGGIVAVGDISNLNISFPVKQQSKIHYHTFVEIFNIDKNLANTAFEKGLQLQAEAQKHHLVSSIVPHAPYTMSKQLMRFIKKEANIHQSIYSIHNQETLSEFEFYTSASGELYELITEGLTSHGFRATGKSSLESLIPFFPENSNVLLVHNIYTNESDIQLIKKNIKRPFFVICPKSNLVIEERLPNISDFINSEIPIAIGTDSLASNNSLSVLEELKTLATYYETITIEDLIKWGTQNGAKALNIDDRFGSIEIGKRPGINLIDNIDFEKMKFTKASSVKVMM